MSTPRSNVDKPSRGRKLLLAVLAAAAFASGIAATPALADPRWHHDRWDYRYHRGWVRYYDGPYVYYAPPPPRVFYAPPPPPVYYAPPPPPPAYYGGPSLNVVIPIR